MVRTTMLTGTLNPEHGQRVLAGDLGAGRGRPGEERGEGEGARHLIRVPRAAAGAVKESVKKCLEKPVTSPPQPALSP